MFKGLKAADLQDVGSTLEEQTNCIMCLLLQRHTTKQLQVTPGVVKLLKESEGPVVPEAYSQCEAAGSQSSQWAGWSWKGVIRWADRPALQLVRHWLRLVTSESSRPMSFQRSNHIGSSLGQTWPDGPVCVSVCQCVFDPTVQRLDECLKITEVRSIS